MKLRIDITRFFFLEIDGLTAFVRLPFIGQGYLNPFSGMSAWDSWAELKTSRELC